MTDTRPPPASARRNFSATFKTPSPRSAGRRAVRQGGSAGRHRRSALICVGSIGCRRCHARRRDQRRRRKRLPPTIHVPVHPYLDPSLQRSAVTQKINVPSRKKQELPQEFAKQGRASSGNAAVYVPRHACPPPETLEHPPAAARRTARARCHARQRRPRLDRDRFGGGSRGVGQNTSAPVQDVSRQDTPCRASGHPLRLRASRAPAEPAR